MRNQISSFYILLAIVALEAAMAFYSIYIFPGAGLVFYGVLFVFFLIYISRAKQSKKSISEAVLFLLYFILLYSISYVHGFLPDNIQWLFLFFGFAFLSSDDWTQYKSIRLFIKILAVLFCLSIIEFLIFAFFHLSLWDITVSRSSIRPYHNLVFNVVDDFFVDIFPRFQSLLDEPGMVGTLSALILCSIWRLRGWTFEKIVFLISGVLSFSLAFFFMMGILAVLNFKFRLKYILPALAVVGLAYFFLQDYIEALVFARFERDDVLSRTAVSFDRAYESAYQSGKLWLGLGATSDRLVTEYGEGNAGIKVWIYQFGIIGLVFLFLLYMRILFGKMKRLGGVNKTFITLVILLCISFIQRSDIEAPYYIVLLFGFPAFYKYEYLDKQTLYAKK